MAFLYHKIYQLGYDVKVYIKSGNQWTKHVEDHLAHIGVLMSEDEKLNAGLRECYYEDYTRSKCPPILEVEKRFEKPLMRTVELDTFATGLALKKAIGDSGFCPVVLNLANELHVGGAWTDQKGSQEECLFHCSSLPVSLWPQRDAGDNRLDGLIDEAVNARSKQEPFYPLSECGVVYSPSVLVTRAITYEKAEPYRLLDPPYEELAVVTVAAQDLRFLSPPLPGPKELDEDLTEKKLRSMLHMCRSKGHIDLVLGAFGCGAFLNNPTRVATIFSKLLEGPEFRGAFRTVIFGIVFDQNNLKAFAEKFPLLCQVGCGEPPSPADKAELISKALEQAVQSHITSEHG